MRILIFIVGLIIFFVGGAILTKPDLHKNLLNFFTKGKRIYLAAVLRLILGVLFLISALECRYPIVIIIFGILFCIGGILIFVMKSEKIRAIVNWFERKPSSFSRALAILVLLIGAIIAYAS
jgi:hypothetical protein